MRKTGKLDYLELRAGDGTTERVKAFYAEAFAWSFTDYGPGYAAFSEASTAVSTRVPRPP